ncbi:c-type cytochrome [bacterium]|nr:c-type cytochrome [bacterium]
MIGSANLTAWFPDWGSTFAPDVDMPFHDIYFAAAAALILTVGLAVVFVRTFMRRGDAPAPVRGGALNLPLLGLWLLGALGLAGFAFQAGLPGLLDRGVAPYGAYGVQVNAREGAWKFTYPEGSVTDTLRVPVGRPVKLALTTEDVAQDLLIPAMRVQQAILPGRTTTAWFEAVSAGTFPVYSGTFSELTQDSLATAVVALAAPDFDAWLASVGDIFVGRTLPEVGELLYNRHGCKACHSLDGSKLVGPSLKNVYGFEFLTTTGETIVADDAYIRQSILEPNASVIDGFQPVMTPFAGVLGDREIGAITEFLKSISDRGDTGGQEGK